MSEDRKMYDAPRPSSGGGKIPFKPTKKKHEEKELGSEILGEQTPE